MDSTDNLMILHISPSYKPAYCYGGPIMSVAKLCEELHKAGIEIQVLTTRANGNCELDVRSGCQKMVGGVKVFYYSRITKDHTHFSPALLIALYRLIKKVRKTDKKMVVHVHSWWNLVAILSSALAIFHGIPVVISPRGMITSYTLSVRNTLYKFIIHKFIGGYLLRNSSIHATSEQEAANIREHLLPSTLAIIPNLVKLPDSGTYKKDDNLSHRSGNFENCKMAGTKKLRKNNLRTMFITEFMSSKISKPESSLNILFLSRIDKKKGLELLLHVLSKLDLNWKLSIAGNGDQSYVRQLKQLSISLMISSKLSWLGQITNEEKYAVFAQHDLTVLLSSNENFGNVIVESLAVGTPVLISDQVGLSTYIQMSDLGWVCSLQPDKVLQTLNRINIDISKRDHIRKNAPDKIEADFNIAEIINDYLQLYKTAACEK